jgi:hypothetical protein
LLTRGDARTLPDAPVAADAALARVIAVAQGEAWVPPPAAAPAAGAERLRRGLGLALARLLLACSPALAARVVQALARGAARAHAVFG